MPHGFRGQAAGLFDLPEEQVRVIAPHVGGAFGGKAGVLAEHTVAIGVARALGRPTRWVDTRSENLVSMPHGRGQVAWYELGLRRDGRITGLRARVLGDAGAYAGFGGALALGPTFMMAQGTYDIPAIAYDAAAVLTNTTPMGAFRGAGRPEAAAHLERMMDLAARSWAWTRSRSAGATCSRRSASRSDAVRGHLRRRRLRPSAAGGTARSPATTGCARSRPPRRAAGDRVQLGIGVSVYVEITAGGGGEFGSVTVHADGTATIAAGTSAHGQGHPTAFSMLVADRLGIPLEQDHGSSSPTPRSCRAAGAPADRVRCSSAAVPCTRRPGRCSSRPASGRRSCWRRPSTTSSSPRTASSACAACRPRP